MTDDGARAGFKAVVQMSSVLVATALFLPGVLVRSAFLTLTARLVGGQLETQGLLNELGGEVEVVGAPPRWTTLFVVAFVGPLIVGSALLLPAIVQSAVLDVRPFAAVSRDPSLIFSHDTSLVPLLDLRSRFGSLGFLRLWFGAACLYCAVPPTVVLTSARTEIGRRSAWSPTRLLLTPLTWFFSVLSALDTLLTFALAGTYLASGLVLLVSAWWFWSQVTRLLL